MPHSEYHYLAAFLSCDEFKTLLASIPENRLAVLIKHPHITFYYKPEHVNPELFGTVIEGRVTGYGNNGINEGFRVELQVGQPELKELYDQIALPHITLSRATNGESVDTRYLSFEPMEPIRFTAVFGARCNDGSLNLGAINPAAFSM